MRKKPQENKWTHRQAKDDGCFDEFLPASDKVFSIHASGGPKVSSGPGISNTVFFNNST